MSHPNLLDSSDVALIVLDIQDGFLKAIHERERVVNNSIKLIEAAKIFSVPIMVTLQNAERLGDCNEEIARALPHNARLNKMSFSCLGGAGFSETLEETMRRQVLICGIETHICVNQTAHDLLARGFSVHIARDAVSSRTPENWVTGIEKMRDSGCVITSTEMAIFELTQDASHPEFKKVLPLVK
ncbi:MAG: hydrolase [Armatimonadetes bacterium]|nr:hydrolase [Armatimonadota bacterium]